MSLFGPMSDQAKHTTDITAVGALGASWLIDHTSLFTALAALLTIFWIAFRLIESGQRIYFNWKYGPNHQTGDE